MVEKSDKVSHLRDPKPGSVQWPARRYSKAFCLRHEYCSRYEGSIGPVSRSSRPADVARRGRLRDLGNERRRSDYRRLFVLLRREGKPSGINRIYRRYREEGIAAGKRRGRVPDPNRGEAQRAGR